MKRLLTLGLMAASLICHAQITNSGWFNAQEHVSGASPSFGFAEGVASISGGVSSIAEVVTPEIQALARGLENDPVRIYNYVHDHIRHVFYFGSKKGAQLTLLERSGNDFDQCALLVALLRAAGYSPTYRFGFLKIPFDSASHNDLRHWLQLSLLNTNWANTSSLVGYLVTGRGYPTWLDFGDNTNIAIHRVWVKLNIGGTDYLLDPAFKVSEPVAGIDLHTASGLDTNALMTAAGGTSTADYVQNLSESSVRNKLRDYTTNLVAYLQSNVPNASVEEIVGGWQITPSTNTALSQSLLFQTYNHGGADPVMDWDDQPTNLMARLTVSFEGTNYQLLVPALQGQRLSLTFDSNGVAQLWQDDTLLMQKTTTGTSPKTSVTLSINHPHGTWNLGDNTFTDGSNHDATVARDYERTNATYSLLYAFEAGPEWLRQRERRLDAYRQQGLADTSREVVSETLNVMGLNWLEQTELFTRMLANQGDVSEQNHHRLGRMGQEKSKGYYIDVYIQHTGLLPASGAAAEDWQRQGRVFDLNAYFPSASEHAVIEQLHPSNMVAASTVKMLQLANTNGLKVFLANSANWSSIQSQLTNYNTGDINANLIAQGYSVLLPQDGNRTVAGTGSWAGYGLVARFSTADSLGMNMLIGGGYQGGFGADRNAVVNPGWLVTADYNRPFYVDLNGALVRDQFGGDPVRMSDGAFTVSGTDLALGEAEPRGISFSRNYSSTRRFHNLAGMANGWTHNYVFNLIETSAAESGLGATTPAQMAPMLVATRAAYELYRTNSNPKNWLVTALIAKWGVDQLINNVVSVTLGQDVVQFVKQPDGTFTPPANGTMTLSKSGSAYSLSQRHGNTFQFDATRKLTNIVDQYGQGLSLAYNASNWVNTVTDWKGRALTLNYSGTPSRLTSISDSTGRSVSYGYATTYSAQGDLISVTDAESKTSTFTYDTNHQITATKDALTRIVTSNAYDGFGRVIEQYTQGDTNQTWRFYWSGFVNTEQDPTGARKRHFHDEKFREVARQDALGNVGQTFYDGQDHVVMVVSPLNEVTQFQYDGRHNLVRSIDPLGITNTFNFDSQDRLMNTVDARGNPTRFGYNSKFQVTATTNGAGDWTTFIYNATDGTLTSRTDAGGTTTYSYDTRGQLSGVSYPSSLGSEGYLNSVLGDVLSRTNARGFITSLQYNARRQLTNTVAPTNLTARVAYDAVGDVQFSTDARGRSKTNFWSATRKLLGTILPATPQGVPTTTNIYDIRDELAQTLNALQKTTYLTNDAGGRLINVVDPLLRKTRFVYDADGRRTYTTNAALEVTRQQWTVRGELASLTDGATHTSVRGYDTAGNQTILTNRNGKRWQFQFDGANRLTNTITPLNRGTLVTLDERGLVKNLREPSTDTITNSYDARGRIFTRSDSIASISYGYDANNNVTSVTEAGKSNVWTFDAYDRTSTYRDTDGNLMQYRHDENGNVTNLVYPGSKNVFYAYDSLNRLTNVTDWANRKTSFEYDLASHLKKILRPNGTIRTMDYDAAGQTTNIVEKTAAGIPIAFFKLNWNSAARVEWEYVAPPPHTYTPPSRTVTYDDDNRIATFNGSTVTNDLDGNMTSGPLTNNVLTNYLYDVRNRLLSAGGQSQGYDAVGNRVALTNGTNISRFVINPNAALSQVLLRVKNGVTNYYVYGVGLLYEADDAGNTKNYHYDYRGSTVALTDSSGNVTDRAEYSLYGSLTYRIGSTDTPFLFNGRYGVQSDANGLLYMRARYYNPYLGRFVNPDPSGFAGGLNFYAYADGNPVSMIDPFGLGAVGENSGITSWLRSFNNSIGPIADSFANLPVLANAGMNWVLYTSGLGGQQAYAGYSSAMNSLNHFAANDFYNPASAESQAMNGTLIIAAVIQPEFAAGSAQNVMNGVRLSEQLTLDSANSAFTASGNLSQGAISGARQIFAPGTLGNPAIPSAFGKYATETFASPSGPFQVHFYMNPITKEIYSVLDYKTVFNQSR